MKSIITFAISLSSIVAIAGCTNPENPKPDERTSDQSAALAHANLAFLTEGASGKATLSEADGTVSLKIEIEGLASGTRGFHLHQIGVCEGPDFKTAGGHLNPLGKSHGSESGDGSHLGDLPNLVTVDGQATSLTIALPGETAQLAEWLFDDDGTAIVIHEGADDYKTDPSGAAGGRIACGVINPT